MRFWRITLVFAVAVGLPPEGAAAQTEDGCTFCVYCPNPS